MTQEHQTPYIGVHLMLIKDGQLLLEQRKGGALDGYYLPVSGHVDKGEGLIDAMCREAKEEANIVLDPKDLKISVVAHLLDAPYKFHTSDIINFFIFTDKYAGEIKNMEPDKTASLAFYDLDNLPDALLAHIKEIIQAYKNGENFIVWADEKRVA